MFFRYIIASSVIFDFHKEKEKIQKIKVIEVAHTIFYAPIYVAIQENFFYENELNVELILANGADKVASSLLSNDVEIDLSGAKATIYVYNGWEKNYLQTFSQLTQKDGSFLVSVKKSILSLWKI